MEISPDAVILAEIPLGPLGVLPLNATLVTTWAVMAILVAGAAAITSRMGPATPTSRWRLAVELLIETLRGQIRDVRGGDPARFLPFIGTLFLFIAVSNLLGLVPGLRSPAGSLSTTLALALSVLVAVPVYAIGEKGVLGYLRNYVRPTPMMLPFNVIGEVSRTVALAVRLYGNVMSGTVIVAILLAVAPFFFPVLLQLLGLLTGMVQAYIFAVLAMVYIASASAGADGRETGPNEEE